MEGALLIEQHGRAYKARRWHLTAELTGTIDTAIAHGLPANWVAGHPSDRYLRGGDRFETGIHHITFARSHQEGWVFVVSSESQFASLAVFNRKYHAFVHRTGVSYRWEHAGGHNLFVRADDLWAVLKRLDSATVDEVEAARRSARVRGSLLPRAGITSEYDLELAFLQHLSSCSSLRSPPEVRISCDGLIPDVVLTVDAGEVIVVELKFLRASRAELDQLEGYLKLPGIVARAGSRYATGVLIARSFGDELIERVRMHAMPVSLYRFGHEDKLQLELVAGRPVLERNGIA